MRVIGAHWMNISKGETQEMFFCGPRADGPGLLFDFRYFRADPGFPCYKHLHFSYCISLISSVTSPQT